VTEASGTLHVVPRSHKIVPDIAAVTADKYFLDFYDELIDHWLEPLCLDAGECVVFDDSLLHWSDTNRTAEPRWAIQIELIPKGSTPVVYYLDAEREPPHFEVYEAGPDFYIEHDVGQIAQRPTALRRIGAIPSRNRRISEAEFAELMAQGDEIRARVYTGGTSSPADP
jgi:hypothetical protein